MTFDIKMEKSGEKAKAEHTSQLFRRFLSQFAATTVENMLLFDMGLCNSFPIILLPALTGILNEPNRNEFLTITATQASWIGSIAYIFEPIGSILSALITDVLGRKGAMMIVNLPLVIAWFLMYNATTLWEIFISTILLGLGAGLMESPIITYVGEICEPNFRGIMIAYTHVGWSLGMMLISVLNTVIPWRMVALCCLSVPVITTFLLCFVPETPLWLLSKNRTAEAEKSLCWLRGWASQKEVAQEFQELQRYSQRYKSCNACIKQNQKCSHPLPTWTEKLGELKRKQTLKPFFIVMALFIIGAFSGIFSMGPFIVQVFKAYDSPIAPDQAAAILSVVNNCGNLMFLLLIRFTGKRYLYLSMLTVVFLCSAVICSYGFAILPAGYNSFDKLQYFSLENKILGYIPFICIILWSFCTFCGVNSMPWQMISEIFPYKTRGVATGLTAALNYLICFVATKTYYNLETTLSLPGVALFNCIVIIGGLILMYKILPETENRSLEDIELHFSDNSKKLTDRKIPKAPQQSLDNDDDSSGEEQTKTDSTSVDGEPHKTHHQNGFDNHAFASDH